MPRVQHKVFLLESTKAAPINRRLLAAIKRIKPQLSRMGVGITVHNIPPKLLPRLQDRLRSKGLVKFPAMKTPDNVYLGEKAIVQVYKENIAKFQKWNRQGGAGAGAGPPGGGTGDLYRDHIAHMMRADYNMAPEEVGDHDGGLSSRVHEEMRRRAALSQRFIGNKAQQPPAGPSASDHPPADNMPFRPPPPSTPYRPPPPPPQDDYNDDIQAANLAQKFEDNLDDSY